MIKIPVSCQTVRYGRIGTGKGPFIKEVRTGTIKTATALIGTGSQNRYRYGIWIQPSVLFTKTESCFVEQFLAPAFYGTGTGTCSRPNLYRNIAAGTCWYTDIKLDNIPLPVHMDLIRSHKLITTKRILRMRKRIVIETYSAHAHKD